jgi:SAM-dependent methyltransferase
VCYTLFEENVMPIHSPWLTQETRYDAMLDAFGTVAAETAVRPTTRSVLDVGCGTGAYTIELARRLRPNGGEVTGIDVDGDLIERARERAWDASVANATFVTADAADHDYAPGQFDAITSRFGTMFFADPVGAFAALGAALVPGGHLTFVCWREPSANGWFSLPMSAAARHLTGPSPHTPTATAGPFALADADHIQRVLRDAGFPDVGLVGIDRLVDVGHDPDDAVAFYGATLGASLEPAMAAAAADDLRHALEPFATADGVLLPASAWLVTARRGRTPRLSRALRYLTGAQTSVKGGRSVVRAGGGQARLGATEGGFGVAVLPAPDELLGPFARRPGPGHVDGVAQLGHVGQDRHLVVAHLDEATVDGHVDRGPTRGRDARVVLRQCGEKRGVAGQEGDLTPAEGARDHHRGLARVQHALGRHDLDLHDVRHELAGLLA